MKTFRILSKEEYTAKLVEENLPRSLPQEPAIPRPTSDAQQAAFKGKVKAVTTEHQLSPVLKRERSREQYFNSRGDLEKEIFYSTNGYPTEIFTWGWLNGMRVGDDKFIDYAENEGPNENGITNLVMSMDTVDGAKPERKADERFSNRYEYSYTPSGKLLEEKMFENTGDLWERTVYKYDAGRIEATVYDEKGMINSKTVETLDSSGQVIEEKKFDDKGKIESSFIYKLEFDSAGNWVVRRTFERKPASGRSIQKQVDIEYRKIEYF